jgi:hypothetical protein
VGSVRLNQRIIILSLAYEDLAEEQTAVDVKRLPSDVA